jgi:hypothetical protein
VTTSVLTTFTRDGLNDHDLQVIRDYALEAPWEWRMALEALVEDGEQYLDEVREHEKLVKEYDTLQDSVKSHIEYLTKCLATFTTELAAADTTGKMRAAFAVFKEDVNDTLMALQPEPKEARSAPPISGGVG